MGVVADTHIPDRAHTLHPDLLPALRAAGVARILHAGDISTPEVIRQLEQIAPVDFVRGNRDWFLGVRSGLVKQLEFQSVQVALMHGHISWFRYFYDKLFYITEGYRFERYLPFLLRAAGQSRVIVFGHTHHAENRWVDGRLFFNPGSAGFGFRRILNPSWGLLTFFPGGKVEGKLLELEGYQLDHGEWLQKA